MKYTHFYKQAIEIAPSLLIRKPSLLCIYAPFLVDTGQLAEAESMLENILGGQISEPATYGLKAVLAKVWIQQLTVPYDPNLLSKLKDLIWETLQFFEQNHRKAEAGLLYSRCGSYSKYLRKLFRSLGVYQ